MRQRTAKLARKVSSRPDVRARELNRQNSDNVTAHAGDLVGKYAGTKDSSHKRNLKGFGSGKPF